VNVSTGGTLDCWGKNCVTTISRVTRFGKGGEKKDSGEEGCEGKTERNETPPDIS